MNILIFNWRDPRNPHAGGAETVTMEHAKAWVRLGHSVLWYTAKFPGAQGEEVIEGVHFVRSRFAHLRAPFFYWQHHHEVDIVTDEIHGISFFTPLYVWKPIVAFIHEVAGEIWDVMYPFPLNIIGKAMERIMFM